MTGDVWCQVIVDFLQQKHVMEDLAEISKMKFKIFILNFMTKCHGEMS